MKKENRVESTSCAPFLGAPILKETQKKNEQRFFRAVAVRRSRFGVGDKAALGAVEGRQEGRLLESPAKSRCEQLGLFNSFFCISSCHALNSRRRGKEEKCIEMEPLEDVVLDDAKCGSHPP